MKLILSWFLALFLIHGFGQDPKEILKKADEKARGVETSESKMTLTIVRPKWSREMTMKSWSKGTKFSMVLVLSPAKEKGTVFLKRDKEVWNWLPTVERNIKLPPSMMSQSWMGTDFTNDDLVREGSLIEDYTHRLLPDSTILGRDCYKIELIPKEDAQVIWGKVIVFVDKKEYVQMRTEMYDEDDYLINIMNVIKVSEMGGKLIASKMELVPVEKRGHKTIMEIESIFFDRPLSEDFFTTQNMRKVGR